MGKDLVENNFPKLNFLDRLNPNFPAPLARSLLDVIADDRLLAEKTGLIEAEVRAAIPSKICGSHG